jgi:xylose isomerase
VREALSAAGATALAEATVDGSGPDELKAEADGLDALAARGYANERLDQLVVDVLLGVR